MLMDDSLLRQEDEGQRKTDSGTRISGYSERVLGMIQEKKRCFPPLDRLPDVFRSYPAIDAVYVFGSAAKGRLNIDSDLDIGIVGRCTAIREKKIDILADLAKAGFCNVDLVFLDVEDIVLRFEVVKHNKVIYKSKDFDPNDFFSKTLRMYDDFLPFLKVQREALKRRWASDKP